MNMKGPSNQLTNVEERLEKLEERLNNLCKETIVAPDSTTVIDALVQRTIDALLNSCSFRLGKWVLLATVGSGIILWAGGTVYSAYQIISIHDRAAEAESKITEREEKVFLKSEKAITASKNLQEEINSRVENIMKDSSERIDKNLSAVETKVDPAKLEIDRGVATVTKAAKSAVLSINRDLDEIKKEQKKALSKLRVPSIDELGKIKSQIVALERTGGRLNLKSIRSFVDLEVIVVLGFSILAFILSLVSLYTARKSRNQTG